MRTRGFLLVAGLSLVAMPAHANPWDTAPLGPGKTCGGGMCHFDGNSDTTASIDGPALVIQGTTGHSFIITYSSSTFGPVPSLTASDAGPVRIIGAGGTDVGDEVYGTTRIYEVSWDAPLLGYDTTVHVFTSGVETPSPRFSGSLANTTQQIVACVAESDSDLICDGSDNCAEVYNPLQADCDGDGIGDACDTDCGAGCEYRCLGTCGDGQLDSGELCDDGGVTVDLTCTYGVTSCTVCSDDCVELAGTASYCGDGVPDPGNGEFCDDGDVDDQDACRNDCTRAVCGDDVVWEHGGGEETCDDGNATTEMCPYGEISCTVCDAQCLLNAGAVAFCGDGTIDDVHGETCDDGDFTDAGNGCDATCGRVDSCGNGLVEVLYEQCDGSDLLGLDCAALGFDSGELACTGGCVLDDSACGLCGDGTVNGTEQCDDGAANSDIAPDACRTDCRSPGCGDGTRDGGEQCDQGDNNSDAIAHRCRSTCVNPSCGDGIIDPAYGEGCDHGGVVDATCTPDCRLVTCGNGILEEGESCDAGPGNSDLTPDACRSYCAEPFCGDGVTDTGEECDDGTANSNTRADVCRLNCRLARCGDAVVDTGEACEPSLELRCKADCAAIRVDDDGCGAAPGAGLWPPFLCLVLLFRRRRYAV